MGKSKVRQITIKTIKKDHLHTCKVCNSDDVWVISKHALKKAVSGLGIARCETCRSVREF